VTAFASLAPEEKEYAARMLLALVWELMKPYADGDSLTLVDQLSSIGGQTEVALKSLARDIWREEDYEPEEWAVLKARLGV
jgi:hypothetical protein